MASMASDGSKPRIYNVVNFFSCLHFILRSPPEHSDDTKQKWLWSLCWIRKLSMGGIASADPTSKTELNRMEFSTGTELWVLSFLPCPCLLSMGGTASEVKQAEWNRTERDLWEEQNLGSTQFCLWLNEVDVDKKLFITRWQWKPYRSLT